MRSIAVIVIACVLAVAPGQTVEAFRCDDAGAAELSMAASSPEVVGVIESGRSDKPGAGLKRIRWEALPGPRQRSSRGPIPAVSSQGVLRQTAFVPRAARPGDPHASSEESPLPH